MPFIGTFVEGGSDERPRWPCWASLKIRSRLEEAGNHNTATALRASWAPRAHCSLAHVPCFRPSRPSLVTNGKKVETLERMNEPKREQRPRTEPGERSALDPRQEEEGLGEHPCGALDPLSALCHTCSLWAPPHSLRGGGQLAEGSQGRGPHMARTLPSALDYTHGRVVPCRTTYHQGGLGKSHACSLAFGALVFCLQHGSDNNGADLLVLLRELN